MARALKSQHSFAKLKSFKTRPRILTLTGCFVEQLGAFMSEHCEVDHLWRVTIPMIAGSSYSGRNFFQSDVQGVAERLNFELSRAYYEKIVSTDYDIVLFDVVSEFSNDFFEKDGTIISDITCGLLGQNWAWPAGFDISSWNRIRPTDPHYAELYIRSLVDIMERKVFGNAKVVMVKRNLCHRTFAATGVQVIDDEQIEFQSACIDAIQSIISGMPNIEVVELNQSSMLTDEWALNGAWKFHPSDEYYLLMLDRVCDLFSVGTDFRSRLIQGAIGRSKQRRYAERAGLRTQITDLSAERANLVEDAQAARSERDALAERLAAASAERDAFATRIQNLTVEQDNRAAMINGEAERQSGVATQLSAAQAERDALAARLLTVSSERDVFLTQIEALTAASVGHIDMTDRLNAVLAERDALAKQVQTMSTERQAFVGGAAGTPGRRDEGGGRLRALTVERDSLSGMARSLAAERDKLSIGLQTLSAERDGLADQLRVAIMERDRFAARAQAAEQDGNIRPTIQRDLDQARADAEQLSTFREKLVMELRFDDGPKALKAVLPFARAIRRTVNVFRPGRS